MGLADVKRHDVSLPQSAQLFAQSICLASENTRDSQLDEHDSVGNDKPFHTIQQRKHRYLLDNRLQPQEKVEDLLVIASETK